MNITLPIVRTKQHKIKLGRITLADFLLRYVKTHNDMYVEPSPLESHHKKYYTYSEIWKMWKDENAFVKLVQDSYTLFEKGWECTHCDWRDVDALGVTMHIDTDGIFSLTYTCHSKNTAKRLYGNYYDFSYEEVKVRRSPGDDYYKITNPENIFPELFDLSEEQIRLLMHAMGQKKNKPLDSYRNHFQEAHNPHWEKMVTMGLAVKSMNGELNYYYVTHYGKMLINSLLPTKNRLQHFSYLKRVAENKSQHINE